MHFVFSPDSGRLDKIRQLDLASSLREITDIIYQTETGLEPADIITAVSNQTFFRVVTISGFLGNSTKV
jgi:hypothetical protein